MTPEKIMYDKAGPKIVENFKKRHFDAYYCPDRESAVTKLFELIPSTDIVAWGGSATMEELGIQDKLKERKYAVIDRDSAATPEERDELSRKALLCDTFILSANAISADGQIVNIDGTGNRVAAMIYGPKSVIVIAGLNKVAPNLDAAISRARNVASPMNKQRFEDLKTPCSVTGLCADCISPDCICAYLAVARISRPAGKIKVILVGENLGM
jgi:L-lactate utilization protein LutB